MSALVLHLRLYDGRYHGEGDWPPSPARLFQALVAGAGLGGPIGVADKEALEWLERQEAPLVAAPLGWRPRRGVLLYMPNNDSDAIGGDPRRMPKIRTAKKMSRPHLFDATVPFVYAWLLRSNTGDEHYAHTICALADRLYQLGRGIDMAWARGDVLDDQVLEDLLSEHPGRILRPSAGKSAVTLASPCAGSLASLIRRHQAFGERFHHTQEGRSPRVVFRKPPGPRFQQIAYDSPPSRQLYELRSSTEEGAFAPWPLVRASVLVVRLRDAAVESLRAALPSKIADIERVLVGRRPDGSNDCRPADRIRIIPLPSIGHVHADHRIRRVLVEVPAGCPIRADDVRWAFSGLEPFDPDTGELLGLVLMPTEDERILKRYGMSDRMAAHGWRTWRSVTPIALPWPGRVEANSRVGRQARAAAAVVQAARHTGVRVSPATICVQREPFEGKGEQAEAFSAGTRFTRDRLCHVEITFYEPISGPLVIGDGRFLGLGVMRPVTRSAGVHAFVIESGLAPSPEPGEITRALRRAVMKRVQERLGPSTTLPAFFSGHEHNGEPARAEQSPHLTFLFDPGRRGPARLLVLAPHVVERRAPTQTERQHLQDLDAALVGFGELRAGSAGLLELRSASVDPEEDPLFAPTRTWENATPYQVTRHVKRVGAGQALAVDVRGECIRRGLPEPEVLSSNTRGVAGLGLIGDAQLTFSVAVRGPIVGGVSGAL